MCKKIFLLMGALGLVLWGSWQIANLPKQIKSTGKQIELVLGREKLLVRDFPSKREMTNAIILFASGDGGWEDLEEAMAEALQEEGYEVIGIDCVKYAKTDYNLATLQADFSKMTEWSSAPFGAHPPPLIVGGYSMGAAQAIAVCGGPNPPKGLVGLLLVDPCSRGRYGLRTADQMDILPTGSGTFSMDEFAPALIGLRVVQWHAAADSIDSRDWLRGLRAEHREFDFPNADHYYLKDREEFLRRFVDSVSWILKPDVEDTATARSKE